MVREPILTAGLLKEVVKSAGPYGKGSTRGKIRDLSRLGPQINETNSTLDDGHIGRWTPVLYQPIAPWYFSTNFMLPVGTVMTRLLENLAKRMLRSF